MGSTISATKPLPMSSMRKKWETSTWSMIGGNNIIEEYSNHYVIRYLDRPPSVIYPNQHKTGIPLTINRVFPMKMKLEISVFVMLTGVFYHKGCCESPRTLANSCIV